MRISDWSSDVCSSDLATFRDGLDVCVTSRSNLQQVLLARLQQQAAIFNPLLIHAHGALVDHAVAFCIARYQPGFLQCRSEEHTSELQSLMRISYAVFCLKKKNEPI